MFLYIHKDKKCCMNKFIVIYFCIKLNKERKVYNNWIKTTIFKLNKLIYPIVRKGLEEILQNVSKGTISKSLSTIEK